MEVGFAQTNHELFNQLRQAGWSSDQIAGSARCYRLALDLMGSAYRQSGKHFVSHLIGTASILAWCDQSVEVVNAGLLHAVYDHGDFGLVADRRGLVRGQAGESVEHVVWRYNKLHWSVDVVKALASGTRPIDSIDRDLLVMRLANHLEDHLDFGMLYYPGARRREGRRAGLANQLVEVARTAGENELAAALDTAFGLEANARIPDAIRARNARTHYRPPLNTMLRPTIALRRLPSTVVSFARRIARWTRKTLKPSM